MSELPYLTPTDPEEVEALMEPDAPPVVIDFWSPSCGPCVAMAPDFKAVASQFGPDELRFCKINVGEHPYLAAPFKIMSTPTVLFMHRGEVLDAVVGRMSADQLGKRSEWLLGKASGKGFFSRLLGR